MTGLLTLEQMRTDVAERLGQPTEEVGLDADLLQLGLDSIGLMRLAAQWGKAGADVTFAELIEQRTLAQWWELVCAARDGASQRHNGRDAAQAQAVEVDEAAPFGLAAMQHAYWVGRTDGQVLGGVGAHFYCEFDGADVDPQRLEQAVAALAAHHPMLRCRFLPDGTQQVMPAPAWTGLTVRDLRTLGAAEAAAELDRLREELSHTRLDVDRGAVFDVCLSLLPEGTRVHVKIEMLVADAESFRILLADLAALYRRPQEPLPPLAYSYARYRATETASRPDGYETARAYWQERLPSLPSGPELPVAKLPEQIAHPKVARCHQWLSAQEWEVLSGRAKQHGVTLSMVFLTAFAQVLAAWSARSRFTLNLPLYDRRQHHPDVGRLAGDFTSLLLLEVDASGTASFAEAARAIQERFGADARHSAYSGVEVLRDLARLHPDRGATAPVVFTSALSLGELFGPDVRECLGEPGWTMSQTPQVWLDCQVTEREGGLFVNWDVVAELFPAGVLDAMFGAFTSLLAWLADGDWTGPMPPLVPAAQLAVREQVNQTSGPVSGRLLHQGFFERAARLPGRVALRGTGVEVSYGDLARHALRLAGLLVSAGVSPGDYVAVCVPKGPGQVVAVLGVLAAGATYVPVGVDQPPARRERIFARAGVRAVVTEDGALPGGQGSATDLCIVSLAAAGSAEPLPGPVPVADEQVAYVIFTSGSTGEPKGVEVPHRAAVNTIEDVCGRFRVGLTDRVLAVSALDFDLSVFDMFALLGVGGAVVVIGEEQRRDARAWLSLVREHGVSIWQSVPALLDMLITAAEDDGGGLGRLRLALLGGDWVGLDLRDRLVAQAPGAKLIALGGTTETAIHSSVFEVNEVPPHWRSVPYGVPLRNQVFRVADEQGRDVPDWVAGELWIGGTGVALGYRGDPERTAQRFVDYQGTRWYRSGDLGRYWPDGTLEFLGRADFQVKVGGHRIELGEVEAALRECPGVRDAVAVTIGTPPKLAAMVATVDRATEATDNSKIDAGPTPADLTAMLRERLPAYMVPRYIQVVAALPLSPNGKTDRKTITRVLTEGRHSGPAAAAEPPTGRVETALAALWADLLKTQQAISRDDSFFALGGDSLLATRLLGRMRAAGLHGGDLRALFAAPALRDFAALLRPGPAHQAAPLTADPANRHEPFPPTDVQRAYWMGRSDEFTLGSVGSHWYWEFDGAHVDLARLEEAWNTLVQRHEMLRAVFGPDGQQRILAEVGRTHIPVTDAAGPDCLAGFRERLAHRIPDPTSWPVVAIEAVRYGQDRVRIAFSFDYILLDALSIVIVFAELATLYRDPGAALPPVEVSFRDYLLSAGPDEASIQADQEYWSARLPSLPPAPQLPLAKDPGQVARPRFARRETRLSAQQWRALRDAAREHGITPASALATAFATVLSAWSGRPDLTLNLTLFDRREVHADIDHILGDFTSLLLVSHEPATGDGWLDLVRRFQEQVWSGMEHNAVSAIWVLRELARRRGQAAVSMPVVFTSALGVSDDLAAIDFPFGELVWGISQTPQVWLDCQVTERDGGLFVNWDVVEELFPAQVLDAMFGAFTGLLGWLAGSDWAGPVPGLVPAAQLAVREQVNQTTGPISGRVLHQGFFEWAEREPGRVALAGAGAEVSYGELARSALRLAGLLASAGVGGGDVVGVCVPKGPGQVVAVLGVLAAGAAYVPVGVDQPAARRERIFARAGVRVIITEEGTLPGDGSVAEGTHVVSLATAESATPLPGPLPVPDDGLAYVIFTSGSTGEPKGVEVTHRAAVNTIEDVCERFGVGASDRVLAVSALDFDLSVFDVFGLLGVGGAVVVIGEEQRRDARAWLSLVREHRVSVWNTVPSLLDMLLITDELGDIGRIKLAMVSGDWVGLDLRDRLVARAPGARLIALGGATEAAIWSNFQEVREVPPHWRSVPYGVPLRNQVFRVADGQGRDCPDWVAGELWIGGAGVALGYRGDPERTAQRFVGLGGLRWYRTGDLGRYWPDGTLEFLGRADFQVKVGGHRIELGEVETALRECPGVRDAVAVTIGSPPQLAAMVVMADLATAPADNSNSGGGGGGGSGSGSSGGRGSGGGSSGSGLASAAHLTAMLAERLPAYMVPRHLQGVAALPLSPNGKIDRKAIAGQLAMGPDSPPDEPPRPGLETEVAALWTGLLRIPACGRSQSFFALGGDSLLATRLVETIRERHGVEVSLRALFARPTVADLAHTIEEQIGDCEEGEL
ncbi:MAG TPA: amino acid adenylation domain-containing protein [Streptosporangiaceae bacterium]|nr:amino acid adenylation domain-containing protein [Streptosporangiaceae bacterium]